MNKINLIIEGMHCENCKKRIEKVLNNHEEITNVIINLETKELSLETSANESSIVELIEDLGFTVTK